MKGSEAKIWLLVLFAVSQATAQDPETGFQSGEEYVTFKDLDVTLNCPVVGSVTWSHGNPETTRSLVINGFTDQHNKKLYSCKGDDGKEHYFYIYAKVCKNCVEMDLSMVIVAMFGDIVFTLGVILVVYACAKKKASPAAPQRAAHSRQPSAPPPPEPDYQSLNQATRSRDIYAEAGRRAH